MSISGRQLALASEASSVKTPYFILGAVLVLIAIIFAFTKLPKFKVMKAKHQVKVSFMPLGTST
jgi:fucose permease